MARFGDVGNALPKKLDKLTTLMQGIIGQEKQVTHLPPNEGEVYTSA